MNRIRMLALFILCLLGMVVVVIKMALQILTGNEGAHRAIAIALDRAGNVALNGNWWETISGRSGRRWPRAARFINWLFQDRMHCSEAMESDLHKLHSAAMQRSSHL